MRFIWALIKVFIILDFMFESAFNQLTGFFDFKYSLYRHFFRIHAFNFFELLHLLLMLLLLYFIEPSFFLRKQ